VISFRRFDVFFCYESLARSRLNRTPDRRLNWKKVGFGYVWIYLWIRVFWIFSLYRKLVYSADREMVLPNLNTKRNASSSGGVQNYVSADQYYGLMWFSK